MNFIKELLEGSTDDWIHQRFIKFSRGEFDGAAFKIKKSKNKLQITATCDYVTLLGWILTKNCSSDIDVKGAIIARDDIQTDVEGVMDVNRSKNRKGVYTVDVSGTVNSAALADLYKRMPGAYFLLNLKTDGQTLKSKGKLPKPGSKVNYTFCRLSLDNSGLAEVMAQLFFDFDGELSEEASVSHKYVIEKVVAPEGVKDPAKIRLEGKRKGKIVRTVEVDGKSKVTEQNLLI